MEAGVWVHRHRDKKVVGVFVRVFRAPLRYQAAVSGESIVTPKSEPHAASRVFFFFGKTPLRGSFSLKKKTSQVGARPLEHILSDS
jgi:hypothetical protein